MSIKHSLLALLGQGDSYGYQLKAEFERRTGGVWPLNIGQVYTTLDRLERDGLVERGVEDEQGRVSYRITATGREEVGTWFNTPVQQAPQRDELSIKLALATTVPGVDAAALVQAQRKVAILLLQDLRRVIKSADDLAWQLVLESRLYATEAEVRWLDHVESAVTRSRRPTSPHVDAPAPSREGVNR